MHVLSPFISSTWSCWSCDSSHVVQRSMKPCLSEFSSVHKPVRQTSVITECWPVFLGLQPLQWVLPCSEIKIWPVFWTGPSSEGHGPRQTDQSSCSVQQCWISWHGQVVKWWKEKQEAENLAQNPVHLLQLSAAFRSNTLSLPLEIVRLYVFQKKPKTL